jgi:hypothetical protein
MNISGHLAAGLGVAQTLCYPEASIDQTGKQSYPQDSFLPTCSN